MDSYEYKSIRYNVIALITKQIKRHGGYEIYLYIYKIDTNAKIVEEVIMSRSRAFKLFILGAGKICIVCGSQEHNEPASAYVCIYSYIERMIIAAVIINAYPLLTLQYSTCRLVESKIEIDAVADIYKPQTVSVDLSRYK